MDRTLFDRRHLKEYLLYGSLAGLAYVIPVWYFLYKANYYDTAALFLGSIFFMFVIFMYSLKLTKRSPDYKSAWMMILEGQAVVFAGIIASVLCTLILCFIYIPGFMTGNSPGAYLKHAPSGLNAHNQGTLSIMMMTATLENFGAGGFISLLASYAIKPNQTKDKSLKGLEGNY